uniref:Uncharacterized protein n=1 Tax=Oryza glumipatula TaxID=40148 RepID=A0A0G2KBN6_9ORYZ
MLESCSLVIL